MNTEAPYPKRTIDTCSALTGLHPVDLIGIVDELGDVLSELENLFIAIHAASEHRPDNPGLALAHIHGIAGAGRRVASDLANYADCQRVDLMTVMRGHAAQAKA